MIQTLVMNVQDLRLVVMGLVTICRRTHKLVVLAIMFVEMERAV